MIRLEDDIGAEFDYEERVSAYGKLASRSSYGNLVPSPLILFERQAQSILHRIQTKQSEIQQFNVDSYKLSATA